MRPRFSLWQLLMVVFLVALAIAGTQVYQQIAAPYREAELEKTLLARLPSPEDFDADSPVMGERCIAYGLPVPRNEPAPRRWIEPQFVEPSPFFAKNDSFDRTDGIAWRIAGRHPIVGIQLCKADLSDLPANAFSSLAHLRHLTIDGIACRLTADQVTAIVQLPQLKSLRLKAVKLSTDQLQLLARHNQLEELALIKCQLTDADILHLAPLKNLRTLDLSRNAITDIKVLGGLQELRRLDLGDNRVNEKSLLYAIPHLTKIEQLRLDNATITTQVALLVGQLPLLTYLSLDQTSANDEAVACIGKSSSLEALSLSWTDISGNSLGSFKEMQQLRYLRIMETRFGRDNMERLRKNRRNLAISFSSR